MLRPSVTREWVDEGELPKEQTQSDVAEALRCGCVPSKENFECKYQRAPWGGDLIKQRYDRSSYRVGLLQCSLCLKEPGKSEDKAE
ncbi:hypothetical protein BHE74_00056780 [Ensete ventricosum]|nr:hypothetical protein BHE74_00056780 [Ensete ventricosum]